LKDPKNREEHGVVADVVRTTLAPLCDQLEMSDQPKVLKLPNVQHLWTPARGRLRTDQSVVDIAGRLHPTPAVGGQPLEEALRCIAAHERIDRGWYAGPIGAVFPGGDGTFAVAIRSAILEGNSATLFAGCGIV